MKATHFIEQFKNEFYKHPPIEFGQILPISQLKEELERSFYHGITTIAIFKIKYKQPCHLPK